MAVVSHWPAVLRFNCLQVQDLSVVTVAKKGGTERNVMILRFPLTSVPLRYLLGEPNAQT